MNKENNKRSNCKDVFNSFLVNNAKYSGLYEFPQIKSSKEIPNKLIAFSKSISNNNYNQWIHFYEDDYMFERLWNNPKRYLKILEKYNGVILPDFSLYRDMPFAMQLWNIYRSRAIGNWLQSKGIQIIPNIRFGDERTYQLCCDGIEKHSVISIGSHGTIKNRQDRYIFFKGLDVVINFLEPSTVIIYGAAPIIYFQKYQDIGIKIIQFNSDYAISHGEVI